MTNKEWFNRARQIKKTYVKILKKQKYRGGTMICSHNSILCIKNTETDEIEFIIDTKTDRGLQMMNDLNEHLAVPRYEPKVAKQWLNEPLTWNRSSVGFDDPDFSREWESKRVKVVLSEHQLREELKKYLRKQYDTCYDLACRMKEMGIKEI